MEGARRGERVRERWEEQPLRHFCKMGILVRSASSSLVKGMPFTFLLGKMRTERGHEGRNPNRMRVMMMGMMAEVVSTNRRRNDARFSEQEGA